MGHSISPSRKTRPKTVDWQLGRRGNPPKKKNTRHHLYLYGVIHILNIYIFKIYIIRCILTEKYENNWWEIWLYIIVFYLKSNCMYLFVSVFILCILFLTWLYIYPFIYFSLMHFSLYVCIFYLATYFPFMYPYAYFHIYLVLPLQIYPFFMAVLWLPRSKAAESLLKYFEPMMFI